MEYNILNDQVTVQTAPVVRLEEHFALIGNDGKPIDLKVDIIANMDGIPNEYHEIFLNVLTAKYLNKASFGDNPFSQCKPIKIGRVKRFFRSIGF